MFNSFAGKAILSVLLASSTLAAGTAHAQADKPFNPLDAMLKEMPGSKQRESAAPIEPKWAVFQNIDGAAPAGEYCTAAYLSEAGAIVLAGPGGEFKNASITFVGRDIPAIKGEPQKVSVGLLQTGDTQPQGVMAYHFYNNYLETAAVGLEIPSAAALLDNMLDTQNFQLWFEGDPVVDITWTGGFAARDKLKQCLSGQSQN